MARLVSISRAKTSHLFLNISFLFLLSFYLSTQIQPTIPHHLSHPSKPTSPEAIETPLQSLNRSKDGCVDLQNYKDNESKCAFVQSEPRCQSDGFIDYLQIFYCICGQHVIFSYILLVLWLILLFYLFGNTAAYYFCSSLERLSKFLNLSPTIAGVTLLSLGNGAPDVFSSIVSFMGAGSGNVGLNSVLGAAFFVSSVVVGIISILVSPHQISVDKSSFVRDICFFLLALSSLLAVLIMGQINVWAAMAFTSLYLVYVSVVSTRHFCRKKDREVGLLTLDPHSPINGRFFLCTAAELGELVDPLMDSIEKGPAKEDLESNDRTAKTRCFRVNSSAYTYYFGRFLFLLELPLYLPRRLTIPAVCEERWSKPFAVISVTLAPVLPAALWNTKRGDMGLKASLAIYMISGMVGIILGVAAFVTTDGSGPPKSFLFPWLAGGFLMSVIWTYIIAEELVALLVSLGYILGISPSILGLTVLAWGNSLGDLIANVSMAVNGGSDGAQIAISGCYAGPIFNTLVGLGMSFVFSSWQAYPSSYVLPRDPSLFQTLGFLVGALLWALVILPRKGMRLDKVLGGGLLAIYLCFLSLRVAHTLGLVQLHGFLA